MDKENLVMHQALMKLLNDGSFTLKAREVPTFLKVYNWANDLPSLVKEEKPKVTRKKNGRN